MRLILSGHHPRNSTYSTEAGQVVYKVDKPLKLTSSVATIRKAVGTVNGVWHGDLGSASRAKSPFSDEGEEKEKEDYFIHDGDRRSDDSGDDAFADSDSEPGPSTQDVPVLEGHFAFFAQVEFHTFSSSRFRYNGLDVPVSEYFRKEGWSWYGRGRVFKASDGREYRWDLCANHVKMFRNDGSKTQVAKFREWRPSLGPFMKGRPASLEVDPSCESILDEIMMTFIYCHKLRKDREESSRNAAS